ncbi:outer membrane protein OmpA-like peptidoglycan-associated protein [Rhodoferax ferrireducens]|uniref:Outer membrane protein OmpA-like peptidoglycan-associated protein n=2 Tax=Rhodoferax ferrireducens TaxID=192843 RepID=A0ABU2C2T4_9BURK|nr:OmpA family protein [Rhodoferax ferrireducens]MDR7375639.1 outer membrane protein OmpA-like peptidoglycan-associated protein [Rhodoferax ferrireducens]
MAYTSHTLRTSVIACTVAALALGGCANMSETQKGTGIGAGIGAVAGALIGGNKTGAAVGGAVGALGGYVWSKHMQDKKAAMEQATAGTGVAVTQTADNQLKLNIPSDISFDTGRADIKPNLRPILDQFANGLQNQPNTEVRIIGHTDNTGSDAVNNPLSLRRAESARDYLSARGVDSRRVAVAGRGEYEPIADNSSDAGRARNRRVEIYLAERAQQ